MKELTENKRSQETKSGIKNSNGTLLTQPDDIKCRWKEYIEELYVKYEKPKVKYLVKMKLILTVSDQR